MAKRCIPAVENLEKRTLMASGADYPGAIWTPAATGNYSTDASNPLWIAIHTTECTAATAITEFTTAGTDVSVNYMVTQTGLVYQFVHDDNIAYDVGNYAYNTDSIGIENERYTLNGVDYNATTAEYQADAQLVVWIAHQYNLPLAHFASQFSYTSVDRIAPADPTSRVDMLGVTEDASIIGHYQVPDPSNPDLGGGADHHTDPVNWDWTDYMADIEGYNYPNTPTNSSPSNSSSVSTLTPTLTASAFTDIDPAVTDKAAEWTITNSSGTVIYDTGTDTHDLTSLSVPAGLLSSNSSYTWQVRYEATLGQWSSYSTATKFTTPTVLTNLNLSGPALYLKMDSDGNHMDVWDSTTDTGSPAQQILFANTGTININGVSAGSNVTIDDSAGNLIPSSAINFTGAGTSSNNVLNVVGSASANDTVSLSASQFSLNSKSINFSDIGSFTFSPGTGTDSLTANAGPLTLAASTSGFRPEIFSNITLGTGVKLAVASATNTANRVVLLTGGLTLSGSTGNWQSQLDLGGNDLVVHGGVLSTLTNEIASGYNGSAWTGLGIDSSAAAVTANMALGISTNAGATSAPLISSFDGQTVTSTDVLIKYTLVGDADLSGTVNSSDYTLIDTGYNSKSTGWRLGDFNYDNIINGNDFTLIDNAFNNQQNAAHTATPTALVATTPQIPPTPAKPTPPQPTPRSTSMPPMPNPTSTAINFDDAPGNPPSNPQSNWLLSGIFGDAQ